MASIEATAAAPASKTGVTPRLNDLPEGELWRRRDTVLAAWRACRAHTLDLVDPLSPEDLLLQSMPDASPGKWHLAHTSWFFETFILERFEPDFRPFDEAFRVLFNSYYNGVGEQHPRAQRGLVSRPALDAVLAYRRDVDRRIERLVAETDDEAAGAEIAALLRLGVNHEQQHQELIVTDIKHAFAQNPAWPAVAPCPASPADGGSGEGAVDVGGADAGTSGERGAAPGWLGVEGGTVRVGYRGAGFCFDNERPVHEVRLGPFEIADRPVNCGEWLAFMADGGYDEPLLWLDEGWAWRREHGIDAPGYWRRRDGAWTRFTLRGERAVDADAPVAHLSYYEAEAFARWAGNGARLPTEAEWETAARTHGFGVEPMGGDPAGEEFRANWEWTGSAYLPYPGFVAAAGAVGEYNGKFMVNQMVLRGRSAATPAGHERVSYRNFFPAHARWQYTGLRLARNGVD